VFKAISFVCTLTTLAFVAACGDDDNPVDSDRNDEHAAAFGFVLYNSGAEIVRYEQGAVTGEIEVGLEKETALLTVRFLNEKGERFTPDVNDGFSLGWEITNSEIAEVEWHEEDGLWSFHIIGEDVGETNMVIKLNHNGHSDFVSLPFEIHVTEGGPGEDHEHDDE